MNKWLPVALMFMVVMLAAPAFAQQPTPLYDWCADLNFFRNGTSSVLDYNLIEGFQGDNYVYGELGFGNYHNLIFNWLHTEGQGVHVNADYVAFGFYNETDEPIQIHGGVHAFGMFDGFLSMVEPGRYYVVDLMPSEPGIEGGSVSVAVQSPGPPLVLQQRFSLRFITVYGRGTSPFLEWPLDFAIPCDPVNLELTATQAFNSPTPSVTPIPSDTLTPSNTFTPSLTLTPSATHTPSPTFTMTSTPVTSTCFTFDGTPVAPGFDIEILEGEVEEGVGVEGTNALHDTRSESLGGGFWRTGLVEVVITLPQVTITAVTFRRSHSENGNSSSSVFRFMQGGVWGSFTSNGGVTGYPSFHYMILGPGGQSFESDIYEQLQLLVEQSGIFNTNGGTYLDDICIFWTGSLPPVTPTPSFTRTPSLTPSPTTTLTPLPLGTDAFTPKPTKTPLFIASPSPWSTIPPTDTPNYALTPSLTPLPTNTPFPTATLLPTQQPPIPPCEGEGCENHDWRVCEEEIPPFDLFNLGNFLAQWWNCVLMPVLFNIQNAITGIGNWIVGTVTSFFGWVGSVFDWIGGMFSNFFGTIEDFIRSLLAFFDLIGRFFVGVVNIIGLIIAIIRHLLDLVSMWIGQFFSMIRTILNTWYLAPPQAIPFLPQCQTNPMSSDICAVYYIVRYTVLGGTLGGLIIPIALVVVDFGIVLSFILTVRNLIKNIRGVAE